jgi:hypothetical protein
MASEEKPETSAELSKLLDRIPYASGAWRRRLISGVIFCTELLLFGAFVLSRHFPIVDNLQSQFNTDLLKTAPFLILTLLVVYAVGALVDVISEGFVVRGVSVMPAVIGYYPSVLFKVAVGAVWPFLLLATVVYSSFARAKYNLDLPRVKSESSEPADFREELSAEALTFYRNRLQENIQIGLDEPFGGKAEAAREAMVYLTPEAHKTWTASLHARNHETSSFLSAAFFGTLACLFLYVQRGPKLGGVLSFYAVLWFISYLFLGYLYIVRRSIASVLEFLAFVDRIASATEAGPIIRPPAVSEVRDSSQRRGSPE